MIKRIVVMVLIFTSILPVIGFHSYKAYADNKTTNINLPRGTWLWNTSLIIDNHQKIINVLKENKINELYLQINPNIEKEYYSKFVEYAVANGINVYALDGEPYWVYSKQRSDLNSFLDWVANYNNTVKTNQKFRGVHLDIEPYVLSEWGQNKDDIIAGYQDCITLIKPKIKAMNLNMALDIPFWFNEVDYNNSYGTGNLAEWVIKNVDSVNIMVYRDSSEQIISVSKAEVDLSQQYNKKCMISVELGYSSEGDYVTFYEEGISFMNSELNIVYNYYKNLRYSNFGFAIDGLL